MAERFGGLAPFLAALKERSGKSLLELSAASGVAVPTLSRRLHTPDGMGLEKILLVGAAMGATEEELETIRDLDAIDRGYLSVPRGALPEWVRAARRMVEGAP
jgi:transcriptional regulator with XRE-family HTH domain